MILRILFFLSVVLSSCELFSQTKTDSLQNRLRKLNIEVTDENKVPKKNYEITIRNEKYDQVFFKLVTAHDSIVTVAMLEIGHNYIIEVRLSEHSTAKSQIILTGPDTLKKMEYYKVFTLLQRDCQRRFGITTTFEEITYSMGN